MVFSMFHASRGGGGGGDSNVFKGVGVQLLFHIESQEEGKDQESKQSNTTPDPGNHMGRFIYEIYRLCDFPWGLDPLSPTSGSTHVLYMIF